MKKILLFLLFPTIAYGQSFNMDLLGIYRFPVELSDIWGYVDESANEYALIGRNDGFSIVDVTDPNNLDEIFFAPGPSSTWRDIKTWGDYAYITCESGPGLLIVNLSPLPGSTALPYTYWTSDTMTFQTAHNIYIDEHGVAYIFGANYGVGGAIMLDLTQDPMDPEVLGIYDQHYLHDGVVRGDTLWGSAVYAGELQVIDVSFKATPSLVASWKTPAAFTHNAWFSDDNNYLFTTDELRNASIAAYDVSNILNPVRLDIWHPADTGIIPHNTHFMDNYIITSHYTYGVNVIDVTRPHNMVETGLYDTSPAYKYEGFHGCWGAYPWLPSGRLIITDIEEGLHVFDVQYTRGCYLEGKVTDLHTGAPIFFPTVEVIELQDSLTGDIVGNYATGTRKAGTYTVRVSKDGYDTEIIPNVQLVNGQLTQLDVQLNNWPSAIEEATSSNGWNIFPQPASNLVNITNEAGLQGYRIFSTEGKLLQEALHSANPASVQIDLDLPAGVYHLEVTTGDGEREIQPLIVE